MTKSLQVDLTTLDDAFLVEPNIKDQLRVIVGQTRLKIQNLWEAAPIKVQDLRATMPRA